MFRLVFSTFNSFSGKDINLNSRLVHEGRCSKMGPVNKSVVINPPLPPVAKKEEKKDESSFKFEDLKEILYPPLVSIMLPPLPPPPLQPVEGIVSANSIILIPCDICKKEIKFSEYEEHAKEHARPHEENKSSIVIPRMMKSISLIPCEQCGKGVNFSDYQAHIDEHSRRPPPPIKKESSNSRCRMKINRRLHD